MPGFAAALTPKSKKRILLRSSWQTVNIGDIAHTPGMLALLEKHLPEYEVTLWPGSVDNGVDAMLMKRFPKLKIMGQSGDDKKEAFASHDFLLHGSGRDGRSLLEKWEPLAKKEGIILVGPDASTSAGWRVPDDGPEFVHDLIEMLADQLDVDRRRVYVFGHSAGAGHALVMALLESEYLAAVAVHAGAMHESAFQLIERAPRKTPIGMWVGTNDALFPLKVVRATRDALKEGGFSPELTEISGHTHWYYDRAADINKKVWAFLRTHALPAEPKYQRYPWAR